MQDERSRHIGKHCLTVAGSSIQLAAYHTMAHCYSPYIAGALLLWACRFLAHAGEMPAV
jgi:hypothetical protein